MGQMHTQLATWMEAGFDLCVSLSGSGSLWHYYYIIKTAYTYARAELSFTATIWHEL